MLEMISHLSDREPWQYGMDTASTEDYAVSENAWGIPGRKLFNGVAGTIRWKRLYFLQHM